ncbi:MAG TPA: hypothetical protein VNQ76_07085, partial [Planctomicrobium sp.]|nr:hypothetical protein [Planctomicrobium sp.]
MRQHIITSSNVYGIQASNVSAVAIVAARSESTLGMRHGKPLSKCLASSSKHRKDHSGSSVVSVVESPVSVVRSVKSTSRPAEVMERPEASASR